jgi:hypothetical protein
VKRREHEALELHALRLRLRFVSSNAHPDPDA